MQRRQYVYSSSSSKGDTIRMQSNILYSAAKTHPVSCVQTTGARSAAGYLHTQSHPAPEFPPLSDSTRLQKRKAGGSHMSHLSTLPAFTHTVWLSPGTSVEYREVLSPSFCPGCTVTPGGHSSGAINACSGDSGTVGVSISSMCVHTYTYPHRKVATGPDGDRVLFPGLRRLI